MIVQKKILNNIFSFFLQAKQYSLPSSFPPMHERVYWHFEADMDRRIETDHRMRIIVFWVDVEVNGRGREKQNARHQNKSSFGRPPGFVNRTVNFDQSKFQRILFLFPQRNAMLIRISNTIIRLFWPVSIIEDACCLIQAIGLYFNLGRQIMSTFTVLRKRKLVSSLVRWSYYIDLMRDVYW